MKSDSSILVALATYNEVANLPSLVDAIRQQVAAADLLVIDDNSQDGTGAWCDQYAKEDHRFTVIHRAGKLGLGTAARVAMEHAIDHHYTWLATLDADWSHNPNDLPRLIEASKHSDVVIGSRYCPGGTIQGWPWYRRWISRCLNRTSRSLLNLSVCDASGAFRIYRVERLLEIPRDQLQSAGYSYLEELLWHLQKTTATFAEIPIEFRERRAGQSKANLQEVWGKLSTIVRLACQR